ncbi:MAG TPA: hypothetical protein VG900_10880 [Hyphomicrobiaceae bacterium]|nr:hypothetical protein [Hyphomicrobiaceae bacterium]
MVRGKFVFSEVPMSSDGDSLPAGETQAIADASASNADQSPSGAHDLASAPDAGGLGSELVQAVLQSASGADAHFVGDLGADAGVYDGHVALAAIDAGAPTDIGHALDWLTTAHDLFDVPAIDGLHAHDVLPT